MEHTAGLVMTGQSPPGHAKTHFPASECHKTRGAIAGKLRKGTGDITSFVEYILKCPASTVDKAEEHLSSTLAKTRFWNSIHQLALNERQIKIINLILDGFDGKLTAEKWAKITKCSHATALRDITDLIAKGVLEKDGCGGRSAGYQLRSRNMTM